MRSLEERDPPERGSGATDAVKIDQYLEAIRDVEQRIQIAESPRRPQAAELSSPIGVPAVFTEHAKPMTDLRCSPIRPI